MMSIKAHRTSDMVLNIRNPNIFIYLFPPKHCIKLFLSRNSKNLCLVGNLTVVMAVLRNLSNKTFLAQTTGGGQKVYQQGCPSSSKQHFSGNAYLACFVCYPAIGPIRSKTGARNNHLQMLSATGRTSLAAWTFCPPPVKHNKWNYNLSIKTKPFYPQSFPRKAGSKEKKIIFTNLFYTVY